MISKFMLNALKIENSPRKILKIRFKTLSFVFKSLSKKEYDEILTLTSDESSRAELVCRYALLYPKDIDFENGIFAGFCEVAASVIVSKSLVCDLVGIRDTLHQYRDDVKNLESQCFVIIKTAMPEITYEKYENMTWQEILKLVALSEEILRLQKTNTTNAINGIDIDIKIDTSFVNQVEQNDKNKDDIENDVNAVSREALAKASLDTALSYWKNGQDPAIINGMKNVKVEQEIVPLILTGGRYWNRDDVLEILRNEKQKPR